VLTTQLGALEAGRKAFVQDATGGMALYLDAAVVDGLPAGTLLTVTGTLDNRFAERTLRISLASIETIGAQEQPAPLVEQTGAIGEAIEGLRVAIEGVTVGSASSLSDGLGLLVDDGTGEVRVIVGAEALGGAAVPGGTHVTAIGPVGQRDSSGTGLAGYRIHVTLPGDVVVLPTPTPSPTATPAPTPTSPPAPSPTPTPTATPIPTPTPGPSATLGQTPAPTSTAPPIPTPTPRPTPTVVPSLTVAEARSVPIGTVVGLAGVVTAEGGRLGIPPLIAIADGTGGIAVRLPDGVTPPARGTTVEVRGPVADPYGQLEIRPTTSGFRITGDGSLPAPVELAASQLGEAIEGRLAMLTGTVTATPRKSTSGDLTIDLSDGQGTTFRVVADASSAVATADLVKGRAYELTGIVGQRASRKGALDGYRLYLRDRGDITGVAAPTGAGASGMPSAVTPILLALSLADGAPVTVEASVTAGVALLDSSGRRIVIQDATGAIEAFLPSGSQLPALGERVRVTGVTGHAWGAPRIVAASIEAAGQAPLEALALNRPPAERDEWLLVRLSGTVKKVERLGDRWRAEIELADGTSAPVLGQAGAGIPSTAIIVGRQITVTGIVRRPYPTASDRRFGLLPRGGADVAIGPSDDGEPDGTLASGSGTASAGSSPAGAAAGQQAGADITPDTDLATLAEHVGERVRVGGLIVGLATDGFDLDDGSALAHVILRDDMAALVAHLREGEAVAATGTVELIDGAPAVVVGADGSLVRVGSLGQALPIGAAGAEADPTSSSGPAGATLAADSAGLGPALPTTSILAMVLISAISVLATLIRRRLVRRRLRAVLVDRLASLRGGGAP
jgi:hypothetical protein